jgi:hypothetical protein
MPSQEAIVNAALATAATASVAVFLAVAPAAPAAGGHGHEVPAAPRSVYDARPALDLARGAMPPPPAGTTDLAFAELLAPIGRRGLAYSDKARALDGKPVRMLGYMVRQDLPADGMLLLAPYPFVLHETEYGLAEDLPASTVHVIVPDRAGEEVPYTPGLLLLTGRLDLGAREEPDGRVSTARLTLRKPPASRAADPKHACTTPPSKEKHP